MQYIINLSSVNLKDNVKVEVIEKRQLELVDTAITYESMTYIDDIYNSSYSMSTPMTCIISSILTIFCK